MDNLEKNKQVSGNSPPKLNQEETCKLNRPITTTKKKSIIKKGGGDERKKTKNKQKKSPCKQRSTTRWLHCGIPPNIQTRTYTDFSNPLKRLSEDRVTLKVILRSHHHPDIKT